MKELRGGASTEVEATPEACFGLVAAVDGYPSWYPDVVRRAQVLDRDPGGMPTRARATVHVAVGPLVRDFDLLLDVSLRPGREVRLTRVPHEPTDPERFQVVWRIEAGQATRLGIELSANLDVPRLVPLGGVGDRLAQGFVDAARCQLEGSGSGGAAGRS